MLYARGVSQMTLLVHWQQKLVSQPLTQKLRTLWLQRSAQDSLIAFNDMHNMSQQAARSCLVQA